MHMSLTLSTHIRRQARTLAVPAIAALMTLPPTLRGASGTWNGTSDNVWVNNANWSASPYPGLGESATFDSSGNSRTNISLAGFWSVANITFAGPSVASYTLGTGPRDSQILVMGTGGEYRIAEDAANCQTFNCAIQLGGGVGDGTYTFRADAADRLLTLGSLSAPTGPSPFGTKTVRLRGTGPITILGNLLREPCTLKLSVDCTNAVTLHGSNTLNLAFLDGTNGVLNLAAGSTTYFKNAWDQNIFASQDTTVNGPGEIVLGTNIGDDHGNNAVASGHTLTINAKLTGDAGFQYYHASSDYAGTVVMNGMNDYSRSTVLYAAGTLSCSFFGLSGAAGNLGTNARIVLDHVGSRLLYTGEGETTDRTLDIKRGGTLEHAGSGTLVFTAPTTSTTSGAKTLTLRNYAAAGGELRGAVVNGSGTASLSKEGDGTWSLTASNTFSGTLAVNGGTLSLSGTDGAAAWAAACAVSNGATLLLDNTAADNNTNRLNDAGSVTLLGGTFDFAHDAGAADFSESVGGLTAGYGTCTVQTDQAAEGQTSSLTFSSLSRLNDATLNFAGTGLGASGRNRVFITGQPEGPLGNWVTLNGQPAYYSVSVGMTTPPAWSVNEIAARGPSSVIPDNASADVRITQPGTDGPITLAGAPANSVAYLRQCTGTPAEVDTANKTMLGHSIGITNGQAALTLGLHVGDGALAPLTPGGILELGNASGSALTVNAALADNGAASSFAKYGTGNVIVAGPTLHTGATEIHEGTLTFAGQDTTQRLAGAVSGGGTLAKTGTNLLDLAAANASFTGQAQLQQGLTRVSQSGALGTADGGTVIAAGATLDLGGAAAMDALNLQQEPVTVAGTGADGQGAVVNRSALQQINALGKVELAGDTAFGGTARWDIRNGELALGDHALTKLGNSTVTLSGSTAVTPGGDAANVDVQEGTFRLQQSVQMGGSAANTVRLRSGTTLDFYDLAAFPAWNLVCDDNTSYKATHSASDSHNRWAGPVTLNGTLQLTFGGDGDYRSGFTGEVTGTGSLLVTNTTGYQPRFFLAGTNNTYSGPNRIVGGWIFARSIRNVGEPCSLGRPMTVADGTIRLGAGTDRPGRLGYNGTGDTTDRVIDLAGRSSGGAWGTISHEGTGPLVISNVTFSTTGSKRLALFGSSTSTAEIVSAIVNSSDSTTEITKEQSVTWILSGNNTYSGPTTINGGTLVFPGSNTLAGAMAINIGVMKLPAGAFMSSAANFGIRNNGAFHLDGGTFIRNTPEGDGETFTIGNSVGGYGHLLVNSGVLTCTRLYAGGLGIGTTRFAGGNAAFNHFVHVGRYSYGTLTVMPGGSVSQPVTSADKNCFIAFDGGRGEVNLLGGAYTQARGAFQIGQNSGAATSIVNLCEGTLTTRYFLYLKGALLVNFSGGTLKYPDIAAVGDPLIPLHASVQAFTYGPHAGFTGGAVIDTNGRDRSLPAVLRAPTGQGVYAIAVGSSGSGYIGEPYVKIAGDGYGACAVANMEDDGQGRGTYRVASVSITCPGVNYTAAPTVTFLGGGTNIVTALAGTATLAANASGGLTKSGAGTLTLSGTNTYTGATTVAGGTLKLGTPAALPTGTPVLLAGGTLDLNGATVTNALSGSGTLTNGVVEAVLSPAGAGTVGTNALTLSVATLRGTYQADVTTAGASDRVAVTGDINLSNVVLQLVDPLALNRQSIYTIMTCTGTASGIFAGTNLPEGWHVSASTASAIKLIYSRGTLIRIR